jgi:arylsulfatase A-like enzyme
MRSKKVFSRRDFLKLVTLIPPAFLINPLARPSRLKDVASSIPNVIFLVFDAWSAEHVQFYGYPRRTMPNLENFTAHATVFHNHYSAGTFTTPGTASLLTGLYPWTHRALSLGSSGIKTNVDHQAFAVFSGKHSTLAYSQNKFADLLLLQAKKYLQTHIRAGAFDMQQRFLYDSPLFANDASVAFASIEDNIFLDGASKESSLFINPIYRLWKMFTEQDKTLQLANQYPLGVPNDTEQFQLGDVVDGAIHALQNLNEPGFAYLHFYPPHENYCPEQKFLGTFSDGWQPPEKPIHPLSMYKKPYSVLNPLNQTYDEYLLSWDAEVSRLFQYLSDSGLLERSYVVITADHGELNERGEEGHFTPLIYNPLVHIPLIISQPGQKERRDIYTPTNSVDVLPTLASLAGYPIPAWAEGQLLPGFGGLEDAQRSIFSMDAKSNAAFAPLTSVTISLLRERHRLTYYNYPYGQQFELYNLDEDPGELTDLYPSQPDIVRHLKNELFQKLVDVNQPFEL